MEEGDAHRLVDRQAIADVLVDYCRCLDRMDLMALKALFTTDCVVDYGDHERLRSRGAATLAASLQRMWRWTRTSHHLSNVRVWFEAADAARTESYVIAWHERPDGSTATLYGQYLDRLRRGAHVWLIAERRMVMNGSDRGFTVPIPPLDRLPPPPGWAAPTIEGPTGRARDQE